MYGDRRHRRRFIIPPGHLVIAPSFILPVGTMCIKNIIERGQIHDTR